MKQARFVQRHQPEWDAFEQWLHTRGALSRPQTRANTGTLGDEQVPQAYRRLCQQLALAQRRGYSPVVTSRLQDLMQRGHAQLYRTRAPRWRAALEFVLSDFPRLVRSQALCMWVATALFVLPLVAVFVALQLRPELVNGLMDPRQVAQMEAMYDPEAAHNRIGRESGGDWQMFGIYIMNNISIGLRTFASGLLFGVGSMLVLVFNGITIGTVFGHLQQIGYGDTLWRFVCGHGAFELTAIVIAGGAGLQLGLGWVAPGRRSRRDGLVHAGIRGARLALGVTGMLLVAAFIEAFWSSIHSIPAAIKYSVAGVLWLLVLLWLWRGGRHLGPLE